MPNNKRFLVVVQSEYVDSLAIVDNPDGEFGGEGYLELKDQHEIIIGDMQASSKEDAIASVANRWEISPEVLDAYEIA